MKGVLVLTEGRSGTNWLGSITSSTNLMGKSGEWLGVTKFKQNGKQSAMQYLYDVANLAATENEFFSIKVFPKHLERFYRSERIDAVKYLYETHEVKLLRLVRKDTFRQAISYGRALQTRQWSSRGQQKREPQYDFRLFCSCFFLIKNSYAFWESYIQFRGYPCETMYYEDLIESPEPYIRFFAEHANVDVVEVPKSDLKIQRDELTENWVNRLKEDILHHHLGPRLPNGPFPKTGLNFARLMIGRSLKNEFL
jgi:trehalose 2-sulfotransferase